ncbi:MAG: TlpA family protein disulfide reductase [Planctomycetes bacterium]|nr:TlpA family protein disulfide reductase [Planctomycetota bacterium]
MTKGRLLLGALALLVAAAALFGPSVVRRFVDARLDAAHGRALEFDLVDTSGARWNAAQLRGKTVVLSFFRSHCEGCLAERDAMRAFAERLDPARAQLLGICMDRVEEYPAETTAATLERMGYRHPVLFADAPFVDRFHGAGWAHVTPITYVVGSDGRIARHLRGHQSLESLLAAVPAEVVRPAAR